MNFRSAFGLILLLVLLGFATQSRADSDGNFCTSKGYLAYETRKGITPGAIGHVLKVVRFEPNRGIHYAGEVTLLDFEVYHLICSEGRVEISGWGNVFTKYVIEIKGTEVRSLSHTEYPGLAWSDAAKDGPAPASLQIFGPGLAPLLLESLDSEHEYQLLRNLTSRDVKEGREYDRKSEIVQLDSKGTVVQRFALYKYRYVESRD